MVKLVSVSPVPGMAGDAQDSSLRRLCSALYLSWEEHLDPTRRKFSEGTATQQIFLSPRKKFIWTSGNKYRISGRSRMSFIQVFKNDLKGFSHLSL